MCGTLPLIEGHKKEEKQLLLLFFMRRYMGFPFHGNISVGECVVALKSLLPVFSKKVTPLSVLNSRPQHIFRLASADYREYMRRFLSHVFPFYLLKLFVVRRSVLGEGLL
jgi:hypothetical protein